MVKIAIVLFAVIGVVLCAPEAPLRRSRLTRQFSRQQIAVANAVDTDEAAVNNEEPQADLPQTKSAPYPAAGFRPERAFNLPTEEADEFNPEPRAEEVDDEASLAPAQEYGPPAQEYGPPSADDDTQADEEALNDEPVDDNQEEINPESERLTFDAGFVRPSKNIRSEKIRAIKAPQPVQQQFVPQPLFYNPQAFVYTSQYQSW